MSKGKFGSNEVFDLHFSDYLGKPFDEYLFSMEEVSNISIECNEKTRFIYVNTNVIDCKLVNALLINELYGKTLSLYGKSIWRDILDSKDYNASLHIKNLKINDYKLSFKAGKVSEITLILEVPYMTEFGKNNIKFKIEDDKVVEKISASKAKDVALKYAYDNHSDNLNIVFERIKEASEIGNFEIHINDIILSDLDITVLREEGYKVYDGKIIDTKLGINIESHKYDVKW